MVGHTPTPIPNDTKDVPYFLVGDNAFSLRPHLMKPYSANQLTREEALGGAHLQWQALKGKEGYGERLRHSGELFPGYALHHAATTRDCEEHSVCLHVTPQPDVHSVPCDAEQIGGQGPGQ